MKTRTSHILFICAALLMIAAAALESAFCGAGAIVAGIAGSIYWDDDD